MSKISMKELLEKFDKGEVEIWINKFNLHLLNMVIKEPFEVVYHDGCFWLRRRKE